MGSSTKICKDFFIGERNPPEPILVVSSHGSAILTRDLLGITVAG